MPGEVVNSYSPPQGLAQVFGSSIVKAYYSLVGETRVKRSVIFIWSEPPKWI